MKTAADFQTSSSSLPSITGGFANSGRFTGCAFSGGSTKPDLSASGLDFAAGSELVSGFADDVESAVVFTGRRASGVGVAEAVAAASRLSLDVVWGVDNFDWPRARGERRKKRTAARTRGFIALESLLGLSQNAVAGSH